MTLQQALEAWINRSKKEREVGRYWASEIRAIKKGYLTPTNFLKKKPVEGEGIGLVSQGIAGEDYITRIFTDLGLDFKPQVHFEIPIPGDEGITVSGKCDFLFKDKVIEAKCPRMICGGIPEKYADQLEANYRGFGLDTYLLEIGFNPFSVAMFKYEPSDERWEEAQTVLKAFHKALSKKKKK